MNAVDRIEESYKAKLEKEVPDIRTGDKVRVSVEIVEGQRRRLQEFEGFVIGIHRAGISTTITVRKVSFGVGVERIFPLYAPTVQEIQVVSHGRIRRAKLYYLRERSGKAARIKERVDFAKIAEQREAKVGQRSKRKAERAETRAKRADERVEQTKAVEVKKVEKRKARAARPAKTKTKKAE